jgi:hypothetical protein
MKRNYTVICLLLLAGAAKAQTITEVFFPKYIQGAGTLNAADDRKVPFVCRMKLGGLTPNATYRYYNRFVDDPNNTTSIGVGGYILVKDTGNFVRVTLASLSTPGRYGEFVADSTGSYTGWFANEVNSGTAFIPGTSLYFRVLLNNGAGSAAVAHRLTAANPVKVINFGTATDSLSGTGLRGTPLRNASAKQFVFLYDNLLAQGRPVTGTFIESDGTDNNIANGYAPFYADSVNGINKSWGTIIPNGLANGILHIQQRSLNGGLSRLYLSFDGKWPSVNRGVANTKNAAGGLNNVLVIDGSRLSIINIWLNGEAVNDETITMEWNTYDETNAREYVIEKSTDGGQTFSPLSTVKALGNKPVYTLSDKRTETTSFYRVTLVGKDGVKLASDVLSVQGLMKVSLYPNPVQDQLVIRHPQADAGAAVQVISIDGRQILTQNMQQGAEQTTVNVSKLISGNYRVIMNMNGVRQSKSFIKK